MAASVWSPFIASACQTLVTIISKDNPDLIHRYEQSENDAFEHRSILFLSLFKAHVLITIDVKRDPASQPRINIDISNEDGFVFEEVQHNKLDKFQIQSFLSENLNLILAMLRGSNDQSQ